MRDPKGAARQFAESLAAGALNYAIAVEAQVCNDVVRSYRVELEPAGRRVDPAQTFVVNTDRAIAASDTRVDWTFQHVIVPPAESVDWRRAVALLSRLAGSVGSLSVEYWIDATGTRLLLGTTAADRDLLRVTLTALYPDAAITDATDPWTAVTSNIAALYECISPAGYQAAIHTSPTGSPWTTVFARCHDLKPGETVVLETRFTPAQHTWRENIPAILHIERLLGHRAPYGQTRSPKDLTEPLFAANVRLMTTSARLAPALEAVRGSFTSEGMPLAVRSIDDYRDVLNDVTIATMCRERQHYAIGQLFSASDLSCFVHLPDEQTAAIARLPIVRGLPVPQRLRLTGLPLGINSDRGEPVAVFQPFAGEQNLSEFILGASRSGKTNFLAHRLVYLARHGFGCGVIDPHRSLALALPGLLDGVAPERVMFLDFDAVVPPAYNPFADADPADRGRIALDYRHSFGSLLGTEHYHRLSHFLGMGLYALLAIGENLATLPTLFSPQGEPLRRRALANIEESAVRQFWEQEFPRYRPDTFHPITNRLTALLLDDRTRRVFTQTANRVNIADAMDTGKVVIVACPANPDAGNIVGGILLAQAKHAAFRRIGTPRAEQRFRLYLDEMHRLLGSSASMESVLHETAKGGLSLHGVTQSLAQLPDELIRAFLTVPNLLCLNINLPDAKTLAPLFRGSVRPEVLCSQQVGACYARIGNDIVNFRCPPPAVTNPEVASRIIAHSHEHYDSVAAAPAPRRRAKRSIETF